MKSQIALRVQKHRDALRAAGLRPIQIWVPDTKQRNFVKKCRQQSELIRHDPQEQEILNFIALHPDDTGWK